MYHHKESRVSIPQKLMLLRSKYFQILSLIIQNPK